MKLKSLVSIAVTMAALAAAPVFASPLLIGEQVEVGASDGVFGPSPIASDANGLYSSVSFQLTGAGGVNTGAGV